MTAACLIQEVIVFSSEYETRMNTLTPACWAPASRGTTKAPSGGSHYEDWVKGHDGAVGWEVVH